MIFDTHAHYDDEAFEEDREALLESLKDGGIGAVMNVAASLESCRTTLLLAGHYDWMYAALGVHPSGTAELDEAGLKWMEFQCSHEKVRAVGEIGLDYYWEEPEHSVQKIWFVRQLDLARKVKLPVIIHSRDAAKDTLDIMKAEKAGDMGSTAFLMGRRLQGSTWIWDSSWGLEACPPLTMLKSLRKWWSMHPLSPWCLRQTVRTCRLCPTGASAIHP